MFHLAAETWLFSTFMRACFDFLGQKTEGGGGRGHGLPQPLPLPRPWELWPVMSLETEINACSQWGRPLWFVLKGLGSLYSILDPKVCTYFLSVTELARSGAKFQILGVWPMQGNSDSMIQDIFSFGIQNPWNICLWNQGMWKHKQLEWENKASGIESVESRIQDCFGFPYMGKVVCQP